MARKDSELNTLCASTPGVYPQRVVIARTMAAAPRRGGRNRIVEVVTMGNVTRAYGVDSPASVLPYVTVSAPWVHVQAATLGDHGGDLCPSADRGRSESFTWGEASQSDTSGFGIGFMSSGTAATSALGASSNVRQIKPRCGSKASSSSG
jgi:hypothetical protein